MVIKCHARNKQNQIKLQQARIAEAAKSCETVLEVDAGVNSSDEVEDEVDDVVNNTSGA